MAIHLDLIRKNQNMNTISQLIAITVLILLILYMTWVKDGEHMSPPLNRRLVIDFSTIAVFWILELLYWFGMFGSYDKELTWILNAALLFFVARLFQLIGQINPWFQDLVNYIKEKMGKDNK